MVSKRKLIEAAAMARVRLYQMSSTKGSSNKWSRTIITSTLTLIWMQVDLPRHSLSIKESTISSLLLQCCQMGYPQFNKLVNIIPTCQHLQCQVLKDLNFQLHLKTRSSRSYKSDMYICFTLSLVYDFINLNLINNMANAVIIIGWEPQSTRFRPLSISLPPPLFPSKLGDDKHI
jgi:hypothetical protein